MNQLKILVIAPHADDEVLGCGATIAKYAKLGAEVHVCIVTKAYTPDWSEEFIYKRKEEIAAVASILQISSVRCLDYPTVKLDTIPQKDLNESIMKVVHELQPQIVFIPGKNDLNKDHRIVFEAALVATRPQNGSSIHKLLSYEVLSETEWGMPLGSFEPNVFEDVTLTIDKKIEAMRAYASEVQSPPHPRSLEAIKVLARKRGFEVGINYAEAFSLVREVKYG